MSSGHQEFPSSTRPTQSTSDHPPVAECELSVRKSCQFLDEIQVNPEFSVFAASVPGKGANAGMDCRASSDVLFLTDEKFDFDVSLSPASSTGGDDDDEDEVFVGPVSHKERCVSVNVASQPQDGGGGVRVSWSPLTGDQLEAVCQEAHRLATQLQSGEPSCLPHEDTETTTDKEEFIQDAEDKLGMLSQTTSALSPIKRQTFCVQDSPMKQLPPAIQHRLLRGSTTNAALSNRPATTTAAPSTRSTARISTSSPLAHSKAQPRKMLRGKSSLAVGVVLPSKPAAPTALCSINKSKVEKPRLQPPNKPVGGWRRSPTPHPTTRAESYEDLLSDSTTVASDISDSSINSSLLGKRTLAPPTKNVVRTLSGVKAPSFQSRRVTDRKNTSSSSSSVSSFNSSMSLSPAKGKLNSSLNRSMSSSTGPAPSSISKPSNASKSRRSTVHTATGPTTTTTGRRSLSAQARKLSEVERSKAARSTPLKKAEVTPMQPTPTKRVLEKTTSVPPTASVRLQSGLKAKTKPEALVAPTPSGGIKGVRHGDDKDVSKMLKPKRLMSVSSMDSLPLKPSVGPPTPSAGDGRLLQVKARRPSALPTPVRRKMSSIPTPTSQSRSPRMLPTSDSDPVPSSSRRERCYRWSLTVSVVVVLLCPVPANTQQVESTDAPEVQPFCLEDVEEMELSAAPPHSVAQPEQSENTDPGAPNQDKSEPGGNLIELETGEESNSKTQEVLLLDLPAPTLPLQEKLLIDLSNTPDLIRTSTKTCTTTQLIDLSSPLIKWSPEEKKENDAPLINLSF
ncbi:hypothetical protein Q5P01_012924 [Channa striata]|uniref:G2 and S phase-expressed protein 1 N-terminal domain-containing protein n=1 Tax=Channa striata TaxID=64152 RepID=A0AA88SRK1_CHASR|nr:hypothetical protein Q5P01_012924 [Channa striata]